MLHNNRTQNNKYIQTYVKSMYFLNTIQKNLRDTLDITFSEIVKDYILNIFKKHTFY